MQYSVYYTESVRERSEAGLFEVIISSTTTRKQIPHLKVVNDSLWQYPRNQDTLEYIDQVSTYDIVNCINIMYISIQGTKKRKQDRECPTRATRASTWPGSDVGV